MDSLTTYRTPEFDAAGRLLLTGFDLRYALTVLLLAERRPMTVRELAEWLAAMGFAPAGRASKTISGALRREIDKGRVVRIRRGVYRIDVVPRSTRSRIRIHVKQLKAIRSAALDRSHHRAA